MDPRDEREIEQALASLASDKQPETMPADVASRFDAHLKSLMAEDATVVRSSRFGKTFAERVTKNSSWLAAASILTVMAFVGVNGLSNDGATVIPPITSEETTAPTTDEPTDSTDTPAPGSEPTAAPTAEPEIPTSPAPQDGAMVYGNGEDVGRDLTQAVRSTNSGENYGGFIGPIAEEILPLEVPGSLTSLSGSHQACIKSLGISGITIGVDSGTYKGSKITAYWIATGFFERGAVLVSPGCNKITFVKE
jgi:cytoskeletal protein RodZ